MSFFSALSLIHSRAQMNLKANAAQTYLSYLWWLLEPALYVALFYVVFEVLMLRGGPGFLYFLILGKIPFLWVSKSLSTGANSIRSNRGLMGQVRLPIGILPYTPLLEAVYKQVFVFAFLGSFSVGKPKFNAYHALVVVVCCSSGQYAFYHRYYTTVQLAGCSCSRCLSAITYGYHVSHVHLRHLF